MVDDLPRRVRCKFLGLGYQPADAPRLIARIGCACGSFDERTGSVPGSDAIGHLGGTPPAHAHETVDMLHLYLGPSFDDERAQGLVRTSIFPASWRTLGSSPHPHPRRCSALARSGPAW